MVRDCGEVECGMAARAGLGAGGQSAGTIMRISITPCRVGLSRVAQGRHAASRLGNEGRRASRAGCRRSFLSSSDGWMAAQTRSHPMQASPRIGCIETASGWQRCQLLISILSTGSHFALKRPLHAAAYREYCTKKAIYGDL